MPTATLRLRRGAVHVRASAGQHTPSPSTSLTASLTSVLAATRIQRPTLDDVQRLSEGRAAKTRGWGSRQTPHRLNAEERKQYALALDKSYLTIKGTGYRKERKGAPLANIYRQYCDANAVPCVNLLLAGTSNILLVEQTTTRRWRVDDEHGIVIAESVTDRINDCISKVGEGFRALDRRALAEVVPWTVLAPREVIENTSTETLDEDLIEHYCSSAIWTIPVSVVGVEVDDRAVAKRCVVVTSGAFGCSSDVRSPRLSHCLTLAHSGSLCLTLTLTLSHCLTVSLARRNARSPGWPASSANSRRTGDHRHPISDERIVVSLLS